MEAISISHGVKAEHMHTPFTLKLSPRGYLDFPIDLNGCFWTVERNLSIQRKFNEIDLESNLELNPGPSCFETKVLPSPKPSLNHAYVHWQPFIFIYKVQVIFCPPHTLHPPCLLISGMEVCILVQQSAFKWPKYLLNSLEARAPGQWCKSAMKRDASSMLRLLSVIHTGMFSPLTPPQRRSRNCDRGSDQ